MRIFAVIAAVTLVAALVLLWRASGDSSPAAVAGANPDNPTQTTIAGDVGQSQVAAEADAADPRLAQIAAALRDKYADRIHRADWQIKVLTHLMSLLQEMYPDSWRDALSHVLQMAFPDLAAQLEQRLEAWLDYQRWMEQVFSVMTFTDAEQRHDTLWAKRLSLFGDDAYVIWAAEQQQRAFNDAVAALDQQSASISEKAQDYVELVRDTWGEQAFGNNGRNTTQLMGEFVRLDSVQEQLRDMTPAEQDQVLTRFRRDMGLDDEAIERWQALDEERREQRTVGNIYMESRAALAGELQGEALEQAIYQLQEDMFGAEEARYIRNEEASGVFRFESEQTIGFD